jgi:UDP-glucose 4-epimerase
MTAIDRTPAFPGTIAVAGGAGRFGKLLIRRLHRTDDVIAIDPRTFEQRPSDVVHRKTELRRRACQNIFRGRRIQAVVHLGPYNTAARKADQLFTEAIENFDRLLKYCDRYNVKKLVLLSSADVYGARASNPQFLAEESPLLAADLSALRDVDMMAQSFFWKRPDIETAILRPTHITGGVAGAMARYLRLSPIPKLMGYDPMIQLVHEEDVVEAIRLALGPGHRGIFNLAGPAPVPLSRVIRRLGRTPIPVPHFLAGPVLKQLKRVGQLEFDPAYVDVIRFVCMVDDSRARRELGYLPARDSIETIEAVDLWE